MFPRNTKAFVTFVISNAAGLQGRSLQDLETLEKDLRRSLDGVCKERDRILKEQITKDEQRLCVVCQVKHSEETRSAFCLEGGAGGRGMGDEGMFTFNWKLLTHNREIIPLIVCRDFSSCICYKIVSYCNISSGGYLIFVSSSWPNASQNYFSR